VRKVAFLYGRSGHVLPQLLFAVQKARNEGLETLVLVPEQYTLEAEKQIIEGLNLKGLLDIEVLSPTRLNRWAQEKAGKASRTVLNNRGIMMAMSLTLTYAKKDLQYFQSVCEKQGFVQKITELIKGLKKGGMELRAFEEYATHAEVKNATKLKNWDILHIWQHYGKLMEHRFLDSEDEQADVLRRLEENDLFKGMALMVYGFDMLSEKTMQVVALAAEQAQRTEVFMLMDDASAPDGDIYRPMRHSLNRLERLLKERGQAALWLKIEEAPLSRAAFVGHLERNLFAQKPMPFEGTPEGFSIRCALNPFQEVMTVAAQMIRLNEEGVKYAEMAVLLLNPDRYKGMLPSVLKGYGIPFYMAEKTPASSHGLIRFLITALEAIGDGFLNATLIAHIHSGYTLLTADEGCLLENYIIANGINRGKFLKPFTRGDAKEEMEGLRQKLMAPLIMLKESMMASRDAESSMTAVFKLLQEVNAYDRLLEAESRLITCGMQAEAARNRQVWQSILSILEQMADLLDGRRAPGAHAAKWLAAGLYETELSALPPSGSEALVGELGHALAGGIKAVFILGFQDDALIRRQSGLLTDEEMAQMKDKSALSLLPVTEEMNCLAKCDLVKAVSLPTEKLFISYADATSSGEALQPHALIEMITARLFKGLQVEGSVLDKPYDSEPMAPLPALEALSFHAREGTVDEKWIQAYHWFMARPDFSPMAQRMMEGLTGGEPAENLAAGAAQTLFHAQSISISRLEQFAACPYKHFVLYGLAPEENKEFVFTPMDKGNFYHAALMEYVSLAAKEPDFPRFSRERSDALLHAAIEKEVESWAQGPLCDTKRGMAEGESYIKIASRAAWQLLKHAENGDFKTIGQEVRFGFEDSLPPLVLETKSGGRVALNGIVDRVDSLKDSDSEYLRIVDYKSFDAELNPSKIMEGLQLQLLLYFQAMLHAHRGAKPAGAFYFHIHEPLIELKEDDKEAAEKEIAGESHLKGIVLEDARIVERMLTEEKNYSAISPIYKKDGELKANADALTFAQWEKLLHHVKRIAEGFADEIMKGQIAPHPSLYKEEKACAFCDFKGICLREDLQDAHGCRRIPQRTMEEMKAALS